MKIYWVLAAITVIVILCCIFIDVGRKDLVLVEGKRFDRDSLLLAKNNEITADEIIEKHLRALGGVNVIRKITHVFEQSIIHQDGKVSNCSFWYISGIKSASIDTIGNYIKYYYYTKTAGISVASRLGFPEKGVKSVALGSRKHHPEHLYGRTYYSWSDLLIDYNEKGIVVKRLDASYEPYYSLEVIIPDGETIFLFIDTQTFLVTKSLSTITGLEGYDEIVHYYDFTTSHSGYTYSRRQEIDVSLPGDIFQIDSTFHTTIYNVSYDLFDNDSIINPSKETIDLYNKNSGLAKFIP